MAQEQPRIRYEAYGPGSAQQPQPGHQVVCIPHRFGPDNQFQWRGVRHELTLNRSFVGWVGGVVVGPVGDAGTYEVQYYDSESAYLNRGPNTRGSMAFRWEEMIHVVVENAAGISSQEVEPT